MAPTVLVWDDEEVLRALVRATLEAEGLAVVEAEDGEESLRRARSVQPDLIVLEHDDAAPQRHRRARRAARRP